MESQGATVQMVLKGVDPIVCPNLGKESNNQNGNLRWFSPLQKLNGGLHFVQIVTFVVHCATLICELSKLKPHSL